MNIHMYNQEMLRNYKKIQISIEIYIFLYKKEIEAQDLYVKK